MKRKIINIDKARCNGCGACAKACHEGAIGMIDGKATLLRDDYCDGFGDCLPKCPTGAITFIEKDTLPYDEQAVLENKKKARAQAANTHVCPGMLTRTIRQNTVQNSDLPTIELPSMLAQWPCQIKLAPISAPYFQDANILIAADCTAYAYANVHADFMKGKVTLIGCPKLDAVDYSEKLSQIFETNDIKSVTVLRMEVPCCGGLENAVKRALQASKKQTSLSVITISINGNVLERKSMQ